MQGPVAGDVILRGSIEDGFELVDAVSERSLVRNLLSIAAAVEAARVRGAPQIWQQIVDRRGRPMGEPFRLFQPIA